MTLCVQADKVEIKEVDFNPEFIIRMLDRIKWEVVVEAATAVSYSFLYTSLLVQ